MAETEKLLDEILESASETPLEFQEHILDVVKAMCFTRSVVEQEQQSGKAYNEKVTA
ncbi:hypothetical protein LI177_06215 [bacterium 210820-DFI.6.37]|nr:hypothetical protein [bacterium 210820-DFI.6.37]